MGKQELFNTMAQGLLQQGETSRLPNGKCAFRGGGGLRCAVGFLIEDREYCRDMEMDAGSTLAKVVRRHARSLADERDIHDLLRSMMEVHDNVPIPHWPVMMQRVARNHRLDDSVIKANLAVFETKLAGFSYSGGFPPASWSAFTSDLEHAKLPASPAVWLDEAAEYEASFSAPFFASAYEKMVMVNVPKKSNKMFFSSTTDADSFPTGSHYETITMPLSEAIAKGLAPSTKMKLDELTFRKNWAKEYASVFMDSMIAKQPKASFMSMLVG